MELNSFFLRRLNNMSPNCLQFVPKRNQNLEKIHQYSQAKTHLVS